MACIDSRMLYTTVASPCQTLRELLAGHHKYINSPAHQLAVLHMHSSPRVFHANRVSEQAQGKNDYIVNIIFLTLLCILHVTGCVQWMFGGETLFNLPTEGRQGLQCMY